MKRLTLVDKAFFLKRTPLFRGLDLDLLLPIADKLDLTEFKPGTILFEQGETAQLMYFILKGSAQLFGLKGEEINLQEGDYFGDESLFSGNPRDYKSLALKDLTVLTLSKPHLHTIIAECPNVGLEFLKVYASRAPLLHEGIPA